MWNANQQSYSHFSDFYTALDISEPVHFWTHVDRNFFAYLVVGNTQEKFVTLALRHLYKYTFAQLYVHSCVQNCGLCTKLDIMHVAFSSNMYKTIQNKIKFNVKMLNYCFNMFVDCAVECRRSTSKIGFRSSRTCFTYNI
jgi:hypothetical protein